MQIELEFEHFKQANPNLRKGDESYSDPNYEEAEKELDEDDRLDLTQVGPDDDSEATARDRAQAIRDKIANAVKHDQPLTQGADDDDEDEWDDVPVGGGSE